MRDAVCVRCGHGICMSVSYACMFVRMHVCTETAFSNVLGTCACVHQNMKSNSTQRTLPYMHGPFLHRLSMHGPFLYRLTSAALISQQRDTRELRVISSCPEGRKCDSCLSHEDVVGGQHTPALAQRLLQTIHSALADAESMCILHIIGIDARDPVVWVDVRRCVFACFAVHEFLA